jgi:hypothetical protein
VPVQTDAKYREAYALRIEQLRNPHLLTAQGAP